MSRFLFSPYRASFCCNWEPPICQVTTPVAVLGISPQQYQEAPRCRHGHPHQRTYHAIVHQVRGSSQLERQGNPGIERVEFMNLLLYWVLYENELVWVFDHGMEYWVGLLLILEAPLGVSVLLTVQGFSCINDASTVTVSLNPKKQNPKEEWSIKTWEHLPTKFNPSAKKTEETKKKTATHLQLLGSHFHLLRVDSWINHLEHRWSSLSTWLEIRPWGSNHPGTTTQLTMLGDIDEDGMLVPQNPQLLLSASRSCCPFWAFGGG